MTEMSVSVRELKSRLNHYLRLAKAGQIIVITERGTPIGRIVPVALPLEARIEAAARSGLVCWNGQRLTLRAPVAEARAAKTVAELVIEDRQ